MRKFIKRYMPIRGREGLTRTEKVVLCAITYNTDNPNSRRTLKDLSKGFGISYRYRLDTIKKLVDKGLCVYRIQGNVKFPSITGNVVSTIQGRGTPVHQMNSSSLGEPQFTTQMNSSSPAKCAIVHSTGEPQFTPPLYILPKEDKKRSREGAEAPASALEGRAGLRSENRYGSGTDTESMRKGHPQEEDDPRGKFSHAKKGCFERLKSTYAQHYPRTRKEEQECWELFSGEVDSWAEYDKCRKAFLLRDSRPATLRDYLKEEPWKR